jgi:hypothetical protein
MRGDQAVSIRGPDMTLTLMPFAPRLRTAARVPA